MASYPNASVISTHRLLLLSYWEQLVIAAAMLSWVICPHSLVVLHIVLMLQLMKLLCIISPKTITSKARDITKYCAFLVFLPTVAKSLSYHLSSPRHLKLIHCPCFQWRLACIAVVGAKQCKWTVSPHGVTMDEWYSTTQSTPNVFYQVTAKKNMQN